MLDLAIDIAFAKAGALAVGSVLFETKAAATTGQLVNSQSLGVDNGMGAADVLKRQFSSSTTSRQIFRVFL